MDLGFEYIVSRHSQVDLITPENADIAVVRSQRRLSKPAVRSAICRREDVAVSGLAGFGARRLAAGCSSWQLLAAPDLMPSANPSPFRSSSASDAPCCTNNAAISCPIPLAAPVTRILRFAKPALTLLSPILHSLRLFLRPFRCSCTIRADSTNEQLEQFRRQIVPHTVHFQ